MQLTNPVLQDSLSSDPEIRASRVPSGTAGPGSAER